MRKIFLISFVLFCTILFSCGGNESKPAAQKTGIDTLHYEDPGTELKDTISVIDSLTAISAATPITTDDSAALALKQRLAADTLSGKISDSVKQEILEVSEFMRKRRNP